jgi:adenosine deaminase
VHVHLEGCFDAALLEGWARKFGEPMPRPRESLFRFEGLADFLHFLDRTLAAPQT